MTRSILPSRHRPVASVGGLLALIAALALTGPGAVLILAPSLALLALLLLGFAPGEALLQRMRARRFPPAAERAPRTLGAPGPRRGLAIPRMPSPAASALAMRPPPVRLPVPITA